MERYGRKQKNYLDYEEFKEVYKNHVFYADDDNIALNRPMPEEAALRGLFDLLATRGQIARADFGKHIKQRTTPSFVSRLRQKLLKGKERLHNAILGDLQDADAFFGAQGVLPLAVVQTLMGDYGLPMVDADKRELTERKFMLIDDEGNEMIAYMELMKDLGPKKKARSMEELAAAATKMQRVARGFLARKLAAELRAARVEHLKDDIKGIAKDKAGKKPVETKKRMTKEEKDAENKKKREATAKAQRQGKRSQLAIDKRMDTVVRSQRDAREKARLERARQEIQKFIKEDLIEGLIERAYCYGESLEVCKDIQRKYEMRPVTKYIYPLLQQFQFSCAGVQPKSL